MTQEDFVADLPKVSIKSISAQHGMSAGTGSHPLVFSGAAGEKLAEQECDLVMPQLFGKLPNLEFFAILAGGKVVKGRVPLLVPQ